ncbi:MAG: peptidase, partial [Flavobacterium psychrophilum]
MKTNTIIRQTLLGTVLLITGFANAKQPKGFGKTFQDPCSATQYDNYLKTAKGRTQTEAQFEQWLAPKIEELRSKKSRQKSGNNVVTLPVVVHVIHNGDAIGEDENIADDQVFSQITVLNNDFRRLSGTPGYVEGNAGTDMKIEFCLAQRDPEGNPTNGIDRVYRNKASWGMMAIETQLKPQTQWDPEKYINIWVCKFGGDLVSPVGEVGGYAFFPEGSGLEGLEGAESYAENDGVTMNYKCFGSSDYYPDGSYLLPGADKGRAAVHEMGHFFGLRHIWGDGEDCTATDYCDDTPAAITMN